MAKLRKNVELEILLKSCEGLYLTDNSQKMTLFLLKKPLLTGNSQKTRVNKQKTKKISN